MAAGVPLVIGGLGFAALLAWAFMKSSNPKPVVPPKTVIDLPPVKTDAEKEAEEKKKIDAYLAAIAKAKADGFSAGQTDGYNDGFNGIAPSPDPNKHVNPSWVSDYKIAFLDGYSAGYSYGHAEGTSKASSGGQWWDYETEIQDLYPNGNVDNLDNLLAEYENSLSNENG